MREALNEDSDGGDEANESGGDSPTPLAISMIDRYSMASNGTYNGHPTDNDEEPCFERREGHSLIDNDISRGES